MTRADQTAESDRFTRDREDADRRYNDALTALDRAIVSAGARAELSRSDLLELATALIVFLQQITAFVETKDRELVSSIDSKLATLTRAVEPVGELRTQMAVVQRTVQSLLRTPAPSTAAPSTPAPSTPAPSTPAPRTPHPAPRTSTQHPAPSTQHPYDHLYVAFEDAFRGSDRAIADRVRAYVTFFAAAQGPVIDLGCGRGELLAALKTANVEARGVDASADMAAIARERGVDAQPGDALAFLESIADDSLDGVIATQLVEHLEPAYLIQLIATAARKLRPGAPIVLETINPACWLAFFSSYIRDLTHVRPIHPETLQYLLRANGFVRVELRYSAPVPDAVKMKTFDPPAAVLSATDGMSRAVAALAHTVNANAAILNSLMFTHMDYAAIGYRA